MRPPSSPHPEQIEQLLVAGRSVAEGFLRNIGHMMPLMLAFCGEEMVIHSAMNMTHPQVKDDFAGILPPNPPTDIEAVLAKQVLSSFGINPDGTRINPQRN